LPAFQTLVDEHLWQVFIFLESLIVFYTFPTCHKTAKSLFYLSYFALRTLCTAFHALSHAQETIALVLIRNVIQSIGVFCPYDFENTA